MKVVRIEAGRPAPLGATPVAGGLDIAVWAPDATAVEVGAANLKNPWAAKEIVEALPAAMEKYKIDNLSDIIGGAHKWQKT